MRRSNAWLGEVGLHTKAHRSDRAARYRERGLERYQELRSRGVSRAKAHDLIQWHMKRAQAQRDRIPIVLDCGEITVCIECQACGKKCERRSGCRVRLLCVRCRGVIAAELRAQFLRARGVVVENARLRGLLNPMRRGGRWSEKFLTLTVPHLPGDSIRSRIARLLAAWVGFLKRLNHHLRALDAHQTTEWLRVIEWTSADGDDGMGHPHIHLWLFSPFLDVELLRDFWRTSLAEVGCNTERPIIDIREVHDPESAARELIKYLTKDIGSNGEKIPAEIYAAVYKALDGRRQIQTSRGFSKLADHVNACECGATLPRRVRVRKSDPPPGEGEPKP